MLAKFIKSKKYWITTAFLLWILTLIFSLYALFIYTSAKNAFQGGFYTLPILLTIVIAIGVILISKVDITSKLHPVSRIALILILFAISWYFAVSRELVVPEEIEFMFKFSLVVSIILTIAISLIALLMKKRVKNANDLLQELKIRS